MTSAADQTRQVPSVPSQPFLSPKTKTKIWDALQIGGFILLLLCAVFALFKACAFQMEQDKKEAAAFAAQKMVWFKECREEKKQYECDALWRASHPAR